MKIKYLDGGRFYYAFIAGGNAVIDDRNYLNKINVFPVPDADTGTNMASTMHSIAESTRFNRSLHATLRSIADAALSGARGNSGLIFAQFIQGISDEIRSEKRISTKSFGESVKKAVQHAYRAMVSPVEGTMLTVMRDWADAVYQHRIKTADFVELFSHSLQAAKKSLKNTPKKLSVLAKAGVVDAGAKGFVDFLEGIFQFITGGRLKKVARIRLQGQDLRSPIHSLKNGVQHRYCTEALLTGSEIDLESLRRLMKRFGDSAIAVGNETKARLHLHTNKPAEFFKRVEDFGTIIQIKADDMQMQYEAAHKRKYKIALVTDSACDLPADMFSKHQIHVVPFNLNFGKSLFLDRITLMADRFYSLLKTSKEHPTTSLPNIATIQNMLSFLATHYESIFVVSISAKLSGTYESFCKAAKSMKEKKISVIDSRHLSVSQGLVVKRILDAIREGKSHKEILAKTQEWVAKTRILVDIRTLKYMVRGGRVSPLKGFIANILNLKPIIVLDEEGKAVAHGKSFSRKSNMKKIVAKIAEMASQGKCWNYAIAHAQNRERADEYADQLTSILGKPPAFISEVAPVVGVHNGIGVLGIGFMFE
ncbi:MAG: DegV family EDD domain-containing protein [Candidatus Aminicenantes bacterium]|nr:DegV family EDD domain-containing protein [Candidatus Aminicenantes bacterium]